MLKIGSLILKSNIISSPMAGITDLPFRMMNRKYGCELAFVEMLDVRSLVHNNPKTEIMLSSNPSDKPLGIQILGTDEGEILTAMEKLSEYKYDILDFNAACPVKKVVKKGAGAYFLKNLFMLSKLLKTIVRISDVPVSVKIRIGWNDKSINGVEAAMTAEDAGVSALFVHGRTREQGYKGKVNYDEIRNVKKSVAIPVIASGDIFSAELGKKMMDETGCDGIAVARGALGNPWIFSQLFSMAENKKIIYPDKNEIINTMLEYADMHFKHYSGNISALRKYLSYYTKGMAKSKESKEKMQTIKTMDDIKEFAEMVMNYS